MISSKQYFILTCILFLSACFPSFSQSPIDSVKKLITENKTEEALNISIAQLEIVEASRNTPLQIKWNSQIGKILRNNQNFESALKYYKIAKKLSIKLNDSLAIANSIFNIGSMQIFEYSIASYNAGNSEVSVDKRDLAFESFYYLLDEFKNVKGTEKIFAKTYANLTGLHSYTEEYDKADFSAHKAIAYFTTLNDTLSVIGVQNNLAVSQIYRKEYNKAERTFLSALPLLKDTTNLKILDYKISNLNNLSQIYAFKGNHEAALAKLEESFILKNILNKKKSSLAIAEIEEKYSQEKALAIQVKKSEKMLLWFTLFTATFLAVIIFGNVLYRNSKLKSRNLALILIKKELEKTNQIEKLQNETQNKVLTATLDARVTERKYIAQVLHDSVSSLLSSASMHLLVIKKKSKDHIEEIDKSRHIIREASDKVRDLSHKLISAILLKFGLVTAAQDLCEKYSNSDLNFELKSEGDVPRFDQDFEIKLHNIIQEITNNIIKHSGATNATIAINYINDIIAIDIEDNGVGFDVKSTKSKNGVGLNLIKSRIKTLKGKFDLSSTKKTGTKIHIEVPVIMV
ncbi:MAG: hypothetical protein COA88_04830 [Kordia sp.]|nr:MAG: hypothetical protein COA88_04830 [Kordia sp.]